MRRVLAMIVALAPGAAGASRIVDSVPARDVLAFVGVVEHRDHASAIWGAGAIAGVEIGLAAWIVSGTGVRASPAASVFGTLWSLVARADRAIRVPIA